MGFKIFEVFMPCFQGCLPEGYKLRLRLFELKQIQLLSPPTATMLSVKEWDFENLIFTCYKPAIQNKKTWQTKTGPPRYKIY